MDVTQEISILNTSVVDLSKDELLKEYSNLKSQYLSQKDLLEEKTQELFDCKRQLNISKALENDLSQEIENLQSIEKIESEKLLKKITGLEEELKTVKEQFREKVNLLEKENALKKDEINAIKIEMENGANDCNGSLTSEDFEKINKEMLQLKEELLYLVNEDVSHRDLIDKLKNENNVNHETLGALKTELDELRETLNYKKEELNNVNQILHTCQEENILLKNELDLLKNNPLDLGTKGNSLFAEVNDRRVEIQQTNDMMKEKFMDMKSQLSFKIKEVTTIKAENSKLSRRWEEDLKEKEEMDSEWKASYEAQINDLNKIIETYEKQAGERIQLENCQLNETTQMEFVRQMIQSKTDQITKLSNELRGLSINKSQLSDSIREIRRELQKWRATAVNRNAEIALLKANVEELKLAATLTTNFTQMDADAFHLEKCSRESQMLDPTAAKEFYNRRRITILQPNCDVLNRPNNATENTTEVLSKEKENNKKKVGFAAGTKETVTERPRRSKKEVCTTVFICSKES